ncbi:MAG: hypothetical protein KBF74_04210 [Ferruginibacter sp.]|nr:hypothetical protein [Ferruginibacter sp.]
MRITFLLISLLFIFSACKKDKFTTQPQIEYKSVDPNYTSIDLGAVIPDITFKVTDLEGDLGLKAGSDTAFIYLDNRLTGVNHKFDSLPFPDLKLSAGKRFEGEVKVSINKVLRCIPLPNGAQHIDTLYFDIYVKDFAKNKSNVITTGDPIFFNCR